MIAFGSSIKPLVGLDISSSSLKAIELTPSGKQLRLHRCGYRPLPPNTVVEGVIKDGETLTQAIRELFQETRFSTKQVAISVSGGATIVKIIQVATMTELDLEDQISLEAEEYIPFDIADVQLDFQILRPSDRGEGMMDVLLAACKKEMINNHIQTVEAAGLKSVHLGMDLFGVINAFERFLQPPGHDPSECVALVNSGASLTNLCILRQGAPLFTRDMPYGGNHLLEDTMRRFGLDREAALEMLASGPSAPREYHKDVLGPFMDQLALHLSHTLDFHSSNNPTLPVQNLYLGGGCALTPGVEEYLTRRLAIPVTVADPLPRLGEGGKFPACHNMGPRFLVALGAALQGLAP